MKKFHKVLLTLGIVVAATVTLSSTSLAASLKDQINQQVGVSQQKAGVADAGDPQQIVIGIVNSMLGVVATGCIALIVWAGFVWINARGDESKVEKARNTIRGAVIGLIIITSAWGVTLFIGKSVQDAVSEEKLRDANNENFRDKTGFNEIVDAF